MTTKKIAPWAKTVRAEQAAKPAEPKRKLTEEEKRERYMERKRAYREANKERIAEYKRAHYEANNKKIAEHQHAYRARKKAEREAAKKTESAAS